LQEVENAISPTRAPAEQQIAPTAFVNSCIHLPEFACIYHRVMSHFMSFVRKIQDMLHLYDFMGVTGPQKILTFVTGLLLKIIE